MRAWVVFFRLIRKPVIEITAARPCFLFVFAILNLLAAQAGRPVWYRRYLDRQAVFLPHSHRPYKLEHVLPMSAIKKMS